MGAGCVGSFRGFRLGGDEVEESLVVLAPGLGGWGPAGDGGRGTRGRHAGSSCPTGGCGGLLREPGQHRVRKESLVKFGVCPMSEGCGTGLGVRGFDWHSVRAYVGGGGFLSRTV